MTRGELNKGFYAGHWVFHANKKKRFKRSAFSIIFIQLVYTMGSLYPLWYSFIKYFCWMASSVNAILFASQYNF